MNWHVSLCREGLVLFRFLFIVIVAVSTASPTSGKESESQWLTQFGALGLGMGTLLANGAGVGLGHWIRVCWNGTAPHFFRMSC
jgi:hypothetical protein